MIGGCVYLIQNINNNKKYIGQTISGIKMRFKHHINMSNSKKINKMLITKAIKKHGKENFNIWVLEYCDSQEELNKTEAFYINYFKTLDKKLGYNIRPIDLNGKYGHSKESKEKIGIIRRGIKKNAKNKYCNIIETISGFEAKILLNGYQKYLGVYITEDEAAKAYDIAILKYIGNTGRLNFPELREEYIKNKIIPKKSKLNIFHKGKSSNIRHISKDSKNRWRFFLRKEKIKYFKSQKEAEKYAVEFLTNAGYYYQEI